MEGKLFRPQIFSLFHAEFSGANLLPVLGGSGSHQEMKRYLALALCALVFALPAWAAEGGDSFVGPFAAPCEFSISFPEKPYVTHRCKGRSGSECYDILTYTRVFDLANAVTVRATCNPVDAAAAGQFSESAMRATLESMVSRKSIGQYDLKFSERDGARSGTLFGEGVKGVTPTLYVAQLWLGQASLLTVEGELTGEANADSDSLFTNILKSIRLKDQDVGESGGDGQKMIEERSAPDHSVRKR